MASRLRRNDDQRNARAVTEEIQRLDVAGVGSRRLIER
jgi:hypothetical protein